MRIKSRIFLSITVFYIILFLVVIGFIYGMVISDFEQKERELALGGVSTMRANIELILQQVINVQALMENNDQVLDALKQDPQNADGEQLQRIDAVNGMLQYAVSVQEYIKGIYILGEEGTLFTSDWAVHKDRLRQFIPLTEEPIYSDLHRQEYHQFSDAQVISYIVPINEQYSRKRLGTLIIDLNYEQLNELFIISSIISDEKILIVNGDGKTLFQYPYNVYLDDVIPSYPSLMHRGTQELTTEIFNVKSFIFSDGLSYSDWKMVRIVSLDKIYQSTSKLREFALLFALSLLVLGFFIAYRLSYQFTDPIIRLNDSMKRVRQGNLDVSIDSMPKDEFGELSESFNAMVKRLNESITASLEAEKRKARLEFRILQEQINPHFLYNTLDSIKWLAVMQNVENISEMSSSLILLLKYNSRRDQLQVELKDEVEALKHYVRIQQFRYGELLVIRYDIAPETLSCKIVKFILQPIVENSILHAFEGYEDDNTIIVCSEIRGDDLYLKIIDNGTGFDARGGGESDPNSHDKKTKQLHQGIGIHNINERLKLYYGERYGVTVKSEVGVGTVVLLTLPALYEYNEHI